MDQIHEVEIRAAYLWALEGNTKNTLAHIEYAKEHLSGIANEMHLANEAVKEIKSMDKLMRYWQQKETGKVCGTDENPGDDWIEISKAEHRKIVDG